MFNKYKFTKDWNNPTDFPTIEANEAKVRADMQLLHDESKMALHQLIDELAAETAPENIGAKDENGGKVTLDVVLQALLLVKHTHADRDELERIAQTFKGITVARELTSDENAVPTAKAVAERMTEMGMGDMTKEVYDPTGRETDVFQYVDNNAARPVHSHDATAIASGILPLVRGGTGGGNAEEARTNIGAAAVKHTHTTSDVVSGVWSVAAGGTGKESHTGNAVLTGNGANAIKNVATADGAFYATAANGAPKFGTLPVAQGGTGATTDIGAVDALGALNLNAITDSDHTISEGDDLNSYTTPGAYRCASAAIAKSLSNMTPYKSAGFRLIVSALSTEQEKCCFQFAFFNAGQSRFYYRHCSSSGAWQPWTRIVTNILTDEEYGTTLPSDTTKGRVFFKKVTD